LREGAPGVDQCLDDGSVVHVPWGIAPGERQYRADDAPRLTGLIKEGKVEHFMWYVGIDWGSESHAVCLVDAGRSSRRRRVVTAETQTCLDWIQTTAGVSA
jgi:hypothetical protein